MLSGSLAIFEPCGPRSIVINIVNVGPIYSLGPKNYRHVAIIMHTLSILTQHESIHFSIAYLFLQWQLQDESNAGFHKYLMFLLWDLQQHNRTLNTLS